MAQFDYEKTLSELTTPQVIAAIADLREHRGRQSTYQSMRPDVVDSLVSSAKIQSIETSNRIENISTSDKRLREIVVDRARPQTHDEREIAGYRYVLDMIHESHDQIPVTPNVILQLHRDLYRFAEDSFAGKWKDSDNVIAERAEDGQMVTRFRPASAAATPSAVERICAQYAEQLAASTVDPLLVSLVFAFDFVSIHPFNDGNGRMSRLLTLLLLYQNGYTVGKYISIEKEIERTKETYYEALAASSAGWQDGKNDYLPFVTYMLGVLQACYKELDARFAALTSPTNSEGLLRAYFEATFGAVTKYQIMEANPTISQRTVERVLKRLQEDGTIEKVGAARATAYRKKNSH